jgi:hypothetical protein
MFMESCFYLYEHFEYNLSIFIKNFEDNLILDKTLSC